MKSLIDSLKPERQENFRIPSFTLKENGEKFASLMKVTGVNASSLAAKIIQFALENDPGIRKLLEENPTLPTKPERQKRTEDSEESSQLFTQQIRK